MKHLISLGGLVLVMLPASAAAAPGHGDEPHEGGDTETSIERAVTTGTAVEPTPGDTDTHPHPDAGETAHADDGNHHAEAAGHHAQTEAEADDARGDHPTEGEAAGGHDHATGHGTPTTGGARLVAFLGKFHPVMIHFPIALILFAMALELLGMTWGRAGLQDAAFYSVLAGAIAAVVAAALGWAAGSGASYAQEIGSVSVLWLHRWLGVSTAGLSVATAAAGWRARKRPDGNAGVLYRLLLVVTAVLVGVTGHFGASLVFGLNHFTL